MEITILNTGERSAAENMALDKALLEELEIDGLPILHLYQWKPEAITYGYFTKLDKYLDLKALEDKGLEAAKRVTGGGVTLHFTDYAFSFFLPKNHTSFSDNTLMNYQFVNQIVVKAISSLLQKHSLMLLNQEATTRDKQLNFCMAKPTKYDVMIQGKKVGGAAQRRTSRGYLHHGTISLALPDPEFLKSILLSKTTVYQAIFQNSFAFLDNHLDQEALSSLRKTIEMRLIEAFQAE